MSEIGEAMLLDTAAINDKLNKRVDNPLRWNTGTFRVPRGVTKAQLVPYVKKAGNTWLSHMAQNGWTLQSKVEVIGPFPAYDAVYNVPLLDQWEFRFRGAFSIAQTPAARIELPRDIIKQERDHTTTVKEAVRVEGLSNQHKMAKPKEQREISVMRLAGGA